MRENDKKANFRKFSLFSIISDSDFHDSVSIKKKSKIDGGARA